MLATSFEREVCTRGVLPTHAHDGVHTCLVVRGAMLDREWRGRSSAAVPGEIIVSPGGSQHSIEVDDTGLVCVVVEWSALARRRSSGNFQMERPLEDVVPLVDGLSTDNPARRAILRSEIVMELRRTIERRAYVELPAWLTEARSEMGVASEDVSISQLARHAGIHRATLARRFRDAYGMAPEHYKILLKLESAAGLMLSGMRPAMAALEAGFADQPHFCRAWRRYLGETPGNWLMAQATIVQDIRSDVDFT